MSQSCCRVMSTFDLVLRTIVITGATSGLGLDAATKLSSMGHKVYLACRYECSHIVSRSYDHALQLERVLLFATQCIFALIKQCIIPYQPCRTPEKGAAAVQQAGAAGSFVCDLTSLQSVRAFAKAWGNQPIDVLCLNAGVAPSTKGDIQRTQEVREVTQFRLSDNKRNRL